VARNAKLPALQNRNPQRTLIRILPITISPRTYSILCPKGLNFRIADTCNRGTNFQARFPFPRQDHLLTYTSSLFASKQIGRPATNPQSKRSSRFEAIAESLPCPFTKSNDKLSYLLYGCIQNLLARLLRSHRWIAKHSARAKILKCES